MEGAAVIWYSRVEEIKEPKYGALRFPVYSQIFQNFAPMYEQKFPYFVKSAVFKDL